MIGALLLTVVSAPQVPTDLDIPGELDRSTVEIAIQTTQTHFVARSYSQSPMVLFFGRPGSRLTTRLNLAPGSEVRYTFCRGCLDDVSVEVLKPSFAPGATWSTTGSLKLHDVAASALETLWVQSHGTRSVGWLGELSGVELAHTGASLLPQSLRTLHPELDGEGDATQPMHVPVITPEADKDDSKPPVIEPSPLPPV